MISLLCVLMLDCQSALGMQGVLHVIPLSVFLAQSRVRLDTASVRKSLSVVFSPEQRGELLLGPLRECAANKMKSQGGGAGRTGVHQ